MRKIVVTTGGAYVDIDGFACAVAYREFLELQGKDAEVVFEGPLNHSVTPLIRSWHVPFRTDWQGDADFVVVDVSVPEYLASFVDQSRVIELYDHHYNYEKFWSEKIGDKSVIEAVGACATLIWERFVSHNLQNNISVTSANLLILAIVSNTLFFKAKVTTTRDKEAFDALLHKVDLPQDWIAQYFKDTESSVLDNLEYAIENDTKIFTLPFMDQALVMSQIELWDGRVLFPGRADELCKILESVSENKPWVVTSPSISEGKNYIFTRNEHIKELFITYFETVFVGDIGTTKRLWMRKELLKVLYSIG